MSAATAFAEIEGHPGYRVGDDGRPWSRYRKGGRRKLFAEWRPMKVYYDRDGYGHLNLVREDGPKVQWKIHQLVMFAFRGPMPEGQCVRHLDGDPTNNRLDNLCYGSYAENNLDLVRHGRAHRGDRHRLAKMDTAGVLELRARHARGESQKELAREYGISKATACEIIRGKSWKHVGEVA